MKKLPLYLLLITACSPAFAQSDVLPSKRFERTQTEAGLTLSRATGIFTLSPSALQYWTLGKNKNNFKIGLGARLTSSFGTGNLEYITADAELTSGKTGPGVLFADQISQNIDTLALSNTQTNALNLFLALRYDLNAQFGAEFNIDLVGVTFGAKQDGVLTYNGMKHASSAAPTVGNVLLISDNDIGTLNSEAMFFYKHKEKFRIKAGVVFLFNEYSLSKPIVYINSKGNIIDTDRYRNKSFQIGVGLNYVLNYYRGL